MTKYRGPAGAPYPHVLNGQGTGCADGTDGAGSYPCPACQWIEEQKRDTAVVPGPMCSHTECPWEECRRKI